MATEGRETSPSTRKQWVWIMLMVNIVFVLVLMTLGIFALRIGNTLPEGTDILFIVAKNPSAEVEDESGIVWEKHTNVDIFKTSYKNGNGEFTVVSNNGDKVFAPGTATSYKFTAQNSGNMAVDYTIDLNFVLKSGGEKMDLTNFPISVRLTNTSGDYLIGDKNTYVPVERAILSTHADLLGAYSYETYELEIYWPYESGNDSYDTFLGNLSAEKEVWVTMELDFYAFESLDATAQGGVQIEVEGTKEYGGTIRWLWLMLLMINTGILVFYIAWLMNKRAQKW